MVCRSRILASHEMQPSRTRDSDRYHSSFRMTNTSSASESPHRMFPEACLRRRPFKHSLKFTSDRVAGSSTSHLVHILRPSFCSTMWGGIDAIAGSINEYGRLLSPDLCLLLCPRKMALSQAIALALAFLATESLCQTSAPPTVTLQNGTYTGVYQPTYSQDYFLGIPFAQPPIGNLRFRNPEPLNSAWDSPRNATAYYPECVGYGGDDIGYEVGEDCLALNVIRPSGYDGQQLPIGVWIHGGG
jgi:Carboxylesterase family